MDSLALATSLTLQYGVPLRFLVDKFAHVRFEPSGWTGNRDIPYAKSIVDYIFRWLGVKFLGPEYGTTGGVERGGEDTTQRDARQNLLFGAATADAPLCMECGSVMSTNGSCSKCSNCGGTSGCS
jgi:ribonucleoside-diphosphate reductase alpha chain